MININELQQLFPFHSVERVEHPYLEYAYRVKTEDLEPDAQSEVVATAAYNPSFSPHLRYGFTYFAGGKRFTGVGKDLAEAHSWAYTRLKKAAE